MGMVMLEFRFSLVLLVDVQFVACLEGDDCFLPVFPKASGPAYPLELASTVSDIDLDHLHGEQLLDRLANQDLVGFLRHLENIGVQGFNPPRCLFSEQRTSNDALGVHASLLLPALLRAAVFKPTILRTTILRTAVLRTAVLRTAISRNTVISRNTITKSTFLGLEGPLQRVG